MNVAELPTPDGVSDPDEHVMFPEGPDTVQVIVPVGLAEPSGPVTVAVRVTFDPALGLVGLFVTTTVGVA